MSTPQRFCAAAVAVLAMCAPSPAHAQTAHSDAVEQVFRLNGVSSGPYNRDAAQCGWRLDANPSSVTTANPRASVQQGFRKTKAAPDSSDWKLYHSLGAVYAAEGNTRLAIRCFEKSVMLNPGDERGQAELSTLLNQDAVRRSSAQAEH